MINCISLSQLRTLPVTKTPTSDNMRLGICIFLLTVSPPLSWAILARSTLLGVLGGHQLVFPTNGQQVPVALFPSIGCTSEFLCHPTSVCVSYDHPHKFLCLGNFQGHKFFHLFGQPADYPKIWWACGTPTQSIGNSQRPQKGGLS